MIYCIASRVNFLLVLGLIAVLSGPSSARAAPSLPPYAYPFADAVLAQDLRGKPIFIELFTSLDCLFCPRAEHVLLDLQDRTNAIVLDYAIDPEGPDYPLGREFSSLRHERYGARLADGLLYTPQMVLNGTVDAVGHEFDDVRAGLLKALAAPPVRLSVREAPEGDLKMVDLPAMPVAKGQGADVFFVAYRPPYTVSKTTRAGALRDVPLVRVATRFAPLGGYHGEAKTITIPFTPNDEAAGFVVFIQQGDNKILGVGEWPPRAGLVAP